MREVGGWNGVLNGCNGRQAVGWEHETVAVHGQLPTVTRLTSAFCHVDLPSSAPVADRPVRCLQPPARVKLKVNRPGSAPTIAATIWMTW